MDMALKKERLRSQADLDKRDAKRRGEMEMQAFLTSATSARLNDETMIAMKACAFMDAQDERDGYQKTATMYLGMDALKGMQLNKAAQKVSWFERRFGKSFKDSSALDIISTYEDWARDRLANKDLAATTLKNDYAVLDTAIAMNQMPRGMEYEMRKAIFMRGLDLQACVEKGNQE